MNIIIDHTVEPNIYLKYVPDGEVTWTKLFSDGQNLMYHLNDVNTIILFLFCFVFHFY